MHMQTFSSQYHSLCHPPLLHIWLLFPTVAVLNLNKYFIFELKMCDSISLECIRINICVYIFLVLLVVTVRYSVVFFSVFLPCRVKRNETKRTYIVWHYNDQTSVYRVWCAGCTIDMDMQDIVSPS